MSDLPAYLESGSGPVLVMLHGIGGDGESFRLQLEYFAARCRCIAWHMPGYGDSPPLPALDFPALAAALLGLLNSLAVAQVHLLGHSIGGMVAQEFAARYPERLASLILSATSPAFGSTDGAWQRQFLAERLAPLDAGQGLAALAPAIVESLVGKNSDPDGLARARACMARVPEASYRAAMQALVGFDRRESLAAITVPTLVLAGEHDRNAPAVLMAKMAAKIPSARYLCLPGVGHLAYLEQPSLFNTVVGGFLAPYLSAYAHR